ncbi:nitrilase-related carbon-nitrogen hydrolase [Micrococcaceae bacterium Sec7.4]
MSAPGTTAFTVACVQTEPVLGDIEANIHLTVAGLTEAAAAGARLAVLPEAASSGYMFRNTAEAAAGSQSVHGGPTIRAWAQMARDSGMWVCGGFVENDGGTLYNSAALIGPDGVAAVYRKVHLWGWEKSLYAPGNLGFPVTATPFGRIGMGICYDAWFPETFRSSALAGADVVCLPSNWVPVPGQPGGLLMAHMMSMTGANSNELYVLACSRSETERGQEFLGSSVVTDPGGWLVAGPAPREGAAVITATIDPAAARAARLAAPFNQPVADRRPEVYRTR